MIIIIKHVISEGPGLLGDFLKKKNFTVKIVELERGDKLPRSLGSIEAVISMGGSMNVYEEEKYTFLEEEDVFLKEVMKREILLLGICLGAQLLAKAQGAAIKKGKCKEIGWFKVDLTAQGQIDTLFAGLDKQLEVFQWHEDEFQIPRKGVLLAEGDVCRNQAFRLAENAYGLQFHIEIKPSMVEEWLKEDLNSNSQVKRNRAKEIINETYEKNNLFLRQADKIFSNFCQIIR